MTHTCPKCGEKFPALQELIDHLIEVANCADKENKQ